jgi:hypothetical protein
MTLMPGVLHSTCCTAIDTVFKIAAAWTSLGSVHETQCAAGCLSHYLHTLTILTCSHTFKEPFTVPP